MRTDPSHILQISYIEYALSRYSSSFLLLISRLLAEVRTYQEKLISNAEEPIWERKWLTIEEAAAYSGIGRTKLRELSNQAGCPFAIWIGNKIHIVRERLDKYIDKQFRI